MVDVIRDILDKQLVDREQQKMGKADGIIIELRAGKPPRLASLTKQSLNCGEQLRSIRRHLILT